MEGPKTYQVETSVISDQISKKATKIMMVIEDDQMIAKWRPFSPTVGCAK